MATDVTDFTDETLIGKEIQPSHNDGERPLEMGIVGDNTRRMTNNTKQGLIVSWGFLAVLIAIGAVMMINYGRRTHGYALSLVKGSLEQERLKVFAGKSNTVNRGEFLMTPAELATAFRDTTLCIPKETIKSRSSDIVCAMPVSDNGAYAIDANGVFRELSKEEFARWPHVSAGEAQGIGTAAH